MDKAKILADLRGQFGKKVLLTTEDIADVIAQSPGAQAVARHRGRFDIPLTKRGKNIFVSIHDLADWLASGGSSTRKQQVATSSQQKSVLARANVTVEPALEQSFCSHVKPSTSTQQFLQH